MTNINRENYHTDTTHISKSGLDRVNQSPAHYRHHYFNSEPEAKQKKHFAIGTGAHTVILEPERIDIDLAIITPYAPKRPTLAQINASKPSAQAVKSIEYWEWFDNEFKGRTPISQADFDTIRFMSDSVFRHPAARDLLRTGTAERITTWQDSIIGVDMKCRSDWDTGGVVVDLKTTEDASPYGFKKSAYKWRYDVQSAVYLDGMKRNDFIFIAVEKSAPYAVGVYVAPPEMINSGREKRDANLNTYANCLSTGKWPAYSEIIEPLPW